MDNDTFRTVLLLIMDRHDTAVDEALSSDYSRLSAAFPAPINIKDLATIKSEVTVSQGEVGIYDRFREIRMSQQVELMTTAQAKEWEQSENRPMLRHNIVTTWALTSRDVRS